MTEYLAVDGGTIAYEVAGSGPLVVLAHGMGDSRAASQAGLPRLGAAGFRVAAVDLRGCGESSAGWPAWSRTAIAGDLLAVIRHLGGPAVLVGHSISGGAATIAAAQEPSLITAVAELGPTTRKQPTGLGGVRRRAVVPLLPRRGFPRNEAGRVGGAARPHRLHAAGAGPDEGTAKHVPQRPGRRRRAARQRPLPGPGRDGHARPRLGRLARRGLGDRCCPAVRPRPP